MSPEEQREHATTVILNRARSADYTDITDVLADVADGFLLADVAEIHQMILTADLTMEWPEIAIEQPGADR